MKKRGFCWFLSLMLLVLSLCLPAAADTTNQIAVIANGQTDIQTYTLLGVKYSAMGNKATDGEYEYIFQTFTKAGAVKSTLTVFVPCALIDNGGGVFKYGGDTMLGDPAPRPGNIFDYYTDTAAVSLERTYGDVLSIFAAVIKSGLHITTDSSQVTLSPTYIFQMKVTPIEGDPGHMLVGLYIDTTEDLVDGYGPAKTVDVVLMGALKIPVP